MESQIKQLQEKYWNGETSLEEERQLKAYWDKNHSMTPESKYFQAIHNRKQSAPSFNHPGKPIKKAGWITAVAMIAGLIAVVFIFKDVQQQDSYMVKDEKEALEITRKALMMVSTGLNEGKVYTAEIKNINKAEELITTE